MGLTTTKEWRWDAPGAHTLTGAVGSARNLLRDFLEECGWSVIWEDAGAQKVVLRNSQAHGGSGCYVRILDDGSYTGGSRVARIDVYEAMSDIDTGTGPTNGGYFWKDRTGSGGPNAYTLHGDERTSYATSYVDGLTPPVNATGITLQDTCCAIGLGDYQPLIVGDPGVFCAAVSTQNPSTSASGKAISSLMRIPDVNSVGQLASFSITRNTSLMMSTETAALWGLLDIPATSRGGFGYGGAGMAMMTNPTPGTIDSHFSSAFLVSAGAVRGKMRGLYLPLNDWTGGGAHVGSTHPLIGVPSESLACLAGSAVTSNQTQAVGRLFVGRNRSWDDV